MANNDDNQSEQYLNVTIPYLEAVAERTTRRLGDAVEAAFLAKASSLYFPVAKPWGEDNRYDFLVDHGRGFYRVQVKCATSFDGHRYSVRAGGVSTFYTADEIDFLVAYIVSENIWYVIPIDAVVPRTGLHLSPRSKRNRFEIYREAWCLLACDPKSRSRKHSNKNGGRNDRTGDRHDNIPSVCRCPELAVRCAVCPEKK
jgi:hypothetical protein